MRIAIGYMFFIFMISQVDLYGQQETIVFDSTLNEVQEEYPSFGSLFSGPPGRALLYSAILPGSGQAYNRKYWKVPVVYAALGVTVYVLLDNKSEFDRFDEAYRSRVDNPDMPIDEFADILTLDRINNFRKVWRKNVQRAYITLGLLYLAQSFEAFVDRHLMDFDISDDLSIKVNIKAHPTQFGFTCTFDRPKSASVVRF